MSSHRGYLVAFVLLTLGLARAARAAGDPPGCSPKCGELPAMETELWNQEFLQARFQKYLDFTIVADPHTVPDPDSPGKTMMESMIDAMQRESAAALTAYMHSAAGGGQKGSGAPGAGTSSDCKIHLYTPAGKMIDYNDAKFRGTHSCWDAEFVLAHEGQHVADCKQGLKINDDYQQYAASDVRAYGAGVKRLRQILADTAKKCGWKGSTHKDKKNPVDKGDEPVVPTPADVNDLVSALKSAPTPAGRGGKR